jgi:hypothetical protein
MVAFPAHQWHECPTVSNKFKTMAYSIGKKSIKLSPKRWSQLFTCWKNQQKQDADDHIMGVMSGTHRMKQSTSCSTPNSTSWIRYL